MGRSARSARFPVAVHIMSMLAVGALHDVDKYFSSGIIARSVAKNDVIVRQILGLLMGAGLAESSAGSKGGARLSRSAATINLLDIYRAVERGSIFQVHEANPKCPIAETVRDRLGKMFLEAESELEAGLAKLPLSDLAVDANRRFEASPNREMYRAMIEPG